MRGITHWLNRHDTFSVAAVSFIIAAISVWLHYVSGTILAYGDAESHINISKRVINGLTPGFGQLGGVWLPLHHLLMVPFVANDFLWRSGIGGAAVSALSFVGSGLFLHLLTKVLTGQKLLGLLTLVTFAANPNILYMLATPMSELPLIAFMLGSMYFFVKWVLRGAIYDLVLASAFVFLASLIRYDAWFLVFVEFTGLIIVAVRDRWPWQRIEGTVILFLILATFGAALWLGWSAVIFHDPLYFMNSSYSAKAQQQAFMSAGELPSYHNLVQALKLYGGAVVWNVGLSICSVSAAGMVAYMAFGRAHKSTKIIVAILLFSPFVFNVLSLYLGISVLFVPGVTPDSFRYHLFNIRYGILMVPAASVLVALLVSSLRPRGVQWLVAGAVVVCVGFFSVSFPITLEDGLTGLSARFPGGVSGVDKVFSSYYDHGFVAFDDFSRSANPIELGVPMNKIIDVGSHPYWEDMLKRPNQYARWIVIRHDDSLDKVFGGNAQFKTDYRAVYVQGDAALYKCVNQCSGGAQ